MRISLSFLATAVLPAALIAVVSPPQAATAQAPSRCPGTAADEASALRAAAGCGSRVEVMSARGEKLRVFANANGSLTAESAAVAQRVRDGSNRWVKPDATLRRAADGRIKPVAAALAISFSGGGTGPAATIGKGAAELGLHWSGALPAPKISGTNATYPEVLPGVDLVLTAQVEGFAETLVVKNAAAAKNPALSAVRFTTTTRKLRLKQGANGSLAAVDEVGATLFGSGTPAMWDSTSPDKTSTDKGGPADGRGAGSKLHVPGTRQAAMPVQLSGDDLIVRPDLGLLRDQATKFPVYIDPGIGRSAWTMINSAFASQSYWSYDRQDCPDPYGSIQCAKVGYTTSPKSMIYRSLFAFPVGTLLRKHVQTAILSMDTVYSYTDTNYGTQVRVAGNISSGTTWSNNASTWGGTIATANSHAHDRVRRRTEWGVTGTLQTVSGGTATTLTLGLRAVSESEINQWKKFDAGTALLTVTYNSYPNAPSDLTVAGNACRTGASRPYVRTLTPVLKGKVSDPDGTGRLLKGTFYWWKLTGGSRNNTDYVAQGSIVSGQYAAPTVPSGRLADGTTYVFQAIANDGIDNGQYSTTCEFTVDVTPPGTPGAVTSTEYPADGQAHGGVGTAGTFVFKPPTTIPADFDGYSYTLDPGVSAATATQVTASTTDHTATISITPTTDQAFKLRVWSRDKAGNFSANPFTYAFTVRAGTGPDARWTFDDQTGSDVSEHGNTLAVAGADWTPGRGSTGKALVADGTSTYGATGGSIATKDPTTSAAITVHSNRSFTVAATVRLDSTAGSGQRVIVAQDGTHTSPFLLSYSVADKKWRFAVAATDVDAPATAAVLSNAIATTGVWTRLLATYDGTGHALKLYVNGALQTATATSATFDALGPVTIGRGRQASAPTGYFAGAIDDVRVYGRLMLTSEPEFKLLQLPNPPLVTFSNGTTAYAGGQLQAVVSAGGDTLVTKVQYKLGASGTLTTVTLPAAGGQTTVNVTSTATGTPGFMAQTVDGSGNQSPFVQTVLTFNQPPSLTGRVTDAVTGAGLSGIVVRLTPGDLTQTTGSTGGYTFSGLAPGAYSVVASSSGIGCAGKIATTEVDVYDAVLIDLMLAPQADLFGYTCKTVANTAFVPGTTKSALTGDDKVSEAVPLPFAMPYYGNTYDTAWISTNGVVTFVDPHGYVRYSSVSLPNRATAPRASLFAFWDDLYVDDQASVWTGSVGTGSDQRFVIEWRNVRIYGSSPVSRLNIEILLSPGGTITYNYTAMTDDPGRGDDAAIGISSPGGSYGLQYSFEQPALVANTAVTFTYPADPTPLEYGSLSGTVTDDGVPVSGIAVTLESSTAKTDSEGHYRFEGLEAGTYGDLAARANCDGTHQDLVDVYGDVVVDLALAQFVDEFGYSCELSSEQEWIPGETQFDRSGHDLPLPFAYPFYGRTFTQAEAGLGYAFLHDPDDSSAGGDIEFWPGANEDGDDTQASIWYTTVGTAPNRQFVIEFRDVTFDEAPSLRLTYEIVLGEDGGAKMIFKDPPDTSQVPYTMSVWFYPHGGGGIEYLEDGRGFPTGKSVVIHAPVA